MTLYVNRDGQEFEVGCTYGPVAFKLVEQASDLRHFWSRLGEQLEEAEREAAEEVSVEEAELVAEVAEELAVEQAVDADEADDGAAELQF